MPPRSNPTARQLRLGVELRKMREAAGIPAREAGALLGGGQPQISHIEGGRYGISEERLRRLAAFYQCGNTALIDALAAMTHEQRGDGWWEAYRGILPAPLLDLSELEHHATYLRSIQVTDIPGALQTEDYAHAVFDSTIPALPRTELDARVAHRQERGKELLARRDTRLDAIVHEAALRMQVGGRRVLREQLRHLLDLSTGSNVTVRVVPFAWSGYIGASRAMLYAGGPVPQLDTVQVESEHGVSFLDTVTHLLNYQALFALAEGAALDTARSRDFVHTIAEQL